MVAGEGAVDGAAGGHPAAEDGADQEGDGEDQSYRRRGAGQGRPPDHHLRAHPGEGGREEHLRPAERDPQGEG